MWRLYLMALIAQMSGGVAWAQRIDAGNQLKNIDFANASSTRPVKTGTTLPATCAVGELFYLTATVAGANLYGCTDIRTWTLLSGPIEMGPAMISPADNTVVVVTDQGTLQQLLSVNPAAVATLAGNNDFTGSNRIDVSYWTVRVANNSGSGTLLNRLAVLAGDGTAQMAPAGTSEKILGVVVSGAGTADMARVAVQGFAACEFDGPTEAGHYVQASSSEAGRCTDAGASTPVSGQILGLVTSTNGGPGAYSVLLHPQVMGAATSASEQQVSWVGTCDGGGNLSNDGWNRDSSGLTNLYCWFDGFTETTSPYAGYTWQASDNGYAYTRFSLPATWLPAQAASLTLFLSEADSGDGKDLGWSVETACIGGNWGGTLSGGVPISFNPAQTGSVASTGNLDKHTANLSPLTLTGCSPGDVLVVKFRRDNTVSDNSTASLLLLGAKLLYTRSL